MKETAPTLKEYAEMVKDKRCDWCVGELSDTVDAYDHYAGWEVKDNPNKQWLSVRCLDCGYDWSLWKLGVDRAFYLDNPYPKTVEK